MPTLSTSEPQFQLAFSSCVAALKRMATYDLDPPLARRLQDLSERKEFLGSEEYEELMALVRFSQQRSVEKLEAQLALNRLGEILPEMLDHP